MKRLGLPLVLALFVALCIVQLDLPGLYYDEALDVVPAMQLLLGQPLELERGVGMWIGGTALPVMVMDYVGAVNTYLALPFFALLGVNVYALRLMTVTGSVLSLVLGYKVGERLFGWQIALLATLLLAVHPSFVFWSRMGITVTSVMTVFSLGSLLAFLRWWDRRDLKSFALGCLLLGLGLWAKLLFLWWIVAIVVVGAGAVLMEARASNRGFLTGAWSSLRARFPRKTAAVGLAGVALGCSPLIWYNLVSGATLETLRRNLVTTDFGVNNLNIAGNLVAVWQTFGTLLNGSYFWYQGGPFANDIYLQVYLGSALVATGLATMRYRQCVKPLVVVLSVTGLIIVQSSVTVSGHWATHLFITYPLPQLAIAAGVVLAWRFWRDGGRAAIGLVTAALVVLPLVGGDLWVYYQYQATMNDTRGLATASNAIYRLADYLQAEGIARPLAVDWGFAKNIQILTQGKVNPREIYGFGKQGGDVFVGEIRKYLADPGNLYLFHSGESTVYPRLDVFLDEAAKLGRDVHVDKVFYQQDGVLVYMLVAAR